MNRIILLMHLRSLVHYFWYIFFFLIISWLQFEACISILQFNNDFIEGLRVCLVQGREMENISRGPTFGDFVTIRTEASMQDVTVTRLQSTRVQTTDSLLPSLLNVMYCVKVSLWTVKNIPCATLKRKGSWVISVYLLIHSLAGLRIRIRIRI